jgi:hypothetical protein
MDEHQALCGCTLGSLPSVSKARKRSPGDLVFLDSRIGDECAKEQSRSPTPCSHRRPGSHGAVSLPAFGEDGGDDRERRRCGSRRPKPLDGARDCKHLRGDREAATKGSHREDGRPSNENPPPTPQVRDPPRQERTAFHVSRMRLRGYRAALEQAGLPWSEVPVYECQGSQKERG